MTEYRRKLDANRQNTITELVRRYAAEIRAISGGERCGASDIRSWIGCGRTTAYEMLRGVPKFAGTSKYDVLTVARHFAERSAKGM